MPENNAKRWTIGSMITTVISIVMMITGILLNDYNFFWMIIVGLLLGITSIICFFMFSNQAKRLEAMFKNTELLAHWSLGTKEQLEKAEEEYKERKEHNKVLITVMTIFFVLIGGFFLLFKFEDGEGRLLFSAIFFGVLILLYIVSFATPRISYKHMKKSVPEVFVGPYSAWVMGEYVQWKAPMSRISDVSLLHTERGDLVIEVNFWTLQRYGLLPQSCRIPVPVGKEEEANKVAQTIASINNVEYNNL
jgi:hypothetical protein